MMRLHESVRQIPHLSSAQKILLNQILYLSARGPCYASDKYFVKFFLQKMGHQISAKTISRWIKLFHEKNLILKESRGSKRTLLPLFVTDENAIATPDKWQPHIIEVANKIFDKFFKREPGRGQPPPT